MASSPPSLEPEPRKKRDFGLETKATPRFQPVSDEGYKDQGSR